MVYFESASTAILSWFYELNKSQSFKPGIMCTLHTFGRDLKWNPHIHMLCSEGGASNTEVFRIVRHINFKALRFRWQKLLLDYLSNNLPPFELSKFKKLKNEIYKDYKNGFYVYARPDNISSIKQTINYVVRIRVDLLWLNLVFLTIMGNMLLFGMIGMKMENELKKHYMFMTS